MTPDESITTSLSASHPSPLYSGERMDGSLD
jgi:hypothetical protein